MKKYIIANLIIRLVIASAVLALGIYLIDAYMGKILPFGIDTDSMWLNGLWGFFGFPISICVISAGISMGVKPIVDFCVYELERNR